jgi:isopenicillin N synthase-like dioxygenase
MSVALVDYGLRSAPAELARSLHQTGFCVIVNHPIPRSLVEHVYDEWSAFFDSDARHRYAFDPAAQDGYFPMPDARDGAPRDFDAKEFFHLFPWGRVPAEVSDAALRYRRSAIELATTLLGWVASNTPASISRRFSRPLLSMLPGGDKNTLLRILRYPELVGDATDAVRAGSHEDTNLLTVLAAPSEPGLQVRDDHGWRDVPHDPASVIVNGGVMLELLSDGYYPSATHRVVHQRDWPALRPRMAMPLFLHPADDVVLTGDVTTVEFLGSRAQPSVGVTSLPSRPPS